MPQCSVSRRRTVRKKESERMNLYDKKTRRIVSILILVLIVAMVATMVIPYLV